MSGGGDTMTFRVFPSEILESESIHIFREAAAQFRRPVLLYSIGKDSTVLLHLARKAFWPQKPPFPLLHIDTRVETPGDDRLPGSDSARTGPRSHRACQ